MVIYATPCAKVEYVEEGKILIIRWNYKPGIEEFKNTYLRVLQIAKEEFPTTFFCTDMSDCGSFDVEQENWLNQEYYMQVYEGLRDDVYAAVLFSEAHFKAIISNYNALKVEPVHSFMHFNYFTRHKEAFYWLNSIQKGQDASLIPNSAT